MAILVVLDDLIFRSKIELAARQAGEAVDVVSQPGAIPVSPRPGAWVRVFIDLDWSAADPLAVIAALRRADASVSIVGFCSHVDVETPIRARAAGCTAVYPRSAFVRRLPELIAGRDPDAFSQAT